MRKKIGGINTSELKKFVNASYSKKGNEDIIPGYTLDKELSQNQRHKVYVDNKTGKAVIAHAGTDSASDWLNNIALATPFYKSTSRYKEAKKAQEAANKKYGKSNVTTTSHSQSGAIADMLSKEGLTDKNISLNPAILNPLNKHKGTQIVRSKTDLVSKLASKNAKDIEIGNTGFNPLTEHGTDILDRIDEQELGGKKYIRPHNSSSFRMHTSY